MLFLGIDSSNYRSSAAVLCDDLKYKSNRKLLNVKGCNYMGFSKKQQKEDDEVLSIEEALALFEER